MTSFSRFLRHPILSCVVLILLCRTCKDFYPLNSFPMYADPGPEPSEYVVVTDDKDQPLPVFKLTGETSAKVKKKYVATRNSLATKAGVKEAATAPPEICAQAWTKVVSGLRHLAKRRRQEFPPTVRLKIGLIYQENGSFREDLTSIAESK